jgi:hypothetical protein
MPKKKCSSIGNSNTAKYGLTHAQMEEILDANGLAKFMTFMNGQTCMLDKKSNQTVYYYGDIHRFLYRLPVVD